MGSPSDSVSHTRLDAEQLKVLSMAVITLGQLVKQAQGFSSGDSLGEVWRHLGGHSGEGCWWHLVGAGQGCCPPYKAAAGPALVEEVRPDGHM